MTSGAVALLLVEVSGLSSGQPGPPPGAYLAPTRSLPRPRKQRELAVAAMLTNFAHGAVHDYKVNYVYTS